MRGEHLLNLKSLQTLHLELNVVPRKKISEKGLLVNYSNKGPVQVEGVIGLALPANYPKVALIETF